MKTKVAKILTLAVIVLSLASLVVLAQTVKVDPKLQAYKKVSGVSGNLSSFGSDTLNNLMTFWSGEAPAWASPSSSTRLPTWAPRSPSRVSWGREQPSPLCFRRNPIVCNKGERRWSFPWYPHHLLETIFRNVRKIGIPLNLFVYHSQQDAIGNPHRSEVDLFTAANENRITDLPRRFHRLTKRVGNDAPRDLQVRIP